MAVVIRMKRTGRRNRPCYRISVADQAAPRDGRTLETLGLYDPIAPKEELRLTLDVERAKHWVGVGALPSETVNSIFERMGVYEGRPARKVSKRPGRTKKTATKMRRTQRKVTTQARKKERRTERLATKRAAAKAAPAEAGAS
jgi:small subunit ribosomal protein S16